MSESRKRIGIFIDYALRIPPFNKVYKNFKQSIFTEETEQFEIESNTNESPELGITDLSRFFWRKELENKKIEDFYLKKKFEGDDLELRNSDFKEFFYNEEHWKKFIEEYSFNLFADAEVPFKKDVELLNIVQTHLFDVILIDDFFSKRKKSNTFYYLSKIRIVPQAVLFLGPGQKINKDTYYGVWNPKENKEQENKEGLGEFENWLKELEFNFNETKER